MQSGTDVRKEKWYQALTDDLISMYIKLRQEDANFMRGEIVMTRRKGRKIKPVWHFYIQKESEEILLPMEDV